MWLSYPCQAEQDSSMCSVGFAQRGETARAKGACNEYAHMIDITVRSRLGSSKMLKTDIEQYTETYSYMHIFIYAYIHICIYAYIHICIYSYMHIFIYSYMHIFRSHFGSRRLVVTRPAGQAVLADLAGTLGCCEQA